MDWTKRASSASASGCGCEGGLWVRCARGLVRLDPGDAFQSLHARPRERRIVYS